VYGHNRPLHGWSRRIVTVTEHQIMKTFKYNELGIHGINEVVVISFDQIITDYFEYWCEKMKRIGKEDLISKERCVEDFCVVHWAWEDK
jgi:hypothetical protein